MKHDTLTCHTCKFTSIDLDAFVEGSSGNTYCDTCIDDRCSYCFENDVYDEYNNMQICYECLIDKAEGVYDYMENK